MPALEKDICPHNKPIPIKLLPFLSDIWLDFSYPSGVRMFTVLEEGNYSSIIAQTWLYRAMPHNSENSLIWGLIQCLWLQNKPEILSGTSHLIHVIIFLLLPEIVSFKHSTSSNSNGWLTVQSLAYNCAVSWTRFRCAIKTASLSVMRNNLPMAHASSKLHVECIN